MKNHLTSFEKKYRASVLSSSMMVEADFIADLEKRLNTEKRKKKKLLFWWIFSVSLVITFALYGMVNNDYGNNFAKKYPNNTAQSNANLKKRTNKVQQERYMDTSSIQVVKSNQPVSHALTMAVTREKEGAFSNSSLVQMPTDTSRSMLSIKRLNELFISLLTINNAVLKNQSLRKKNKQWEMELTSGVNFTRSYLYSDFNLVSSYDLMLTQSESLLKTTNFGLNLYTYAGHFQWGFGVLYTSFGERANFNYLDTLITVNPDNSAEIDTNYIEQWFKGQNKYSFLQVPLSIGYQFRWDHFSITPRYSASFGTRMKEQIGYYPNRNGIGLSCFFAPKFNLQQSLQIEFRTGYNKSFFSITPYLNFNSIQTPPEIFSYRKYINFGFNFGIGYRF